MAVAKITLRAEDKASPDIKKVNDSVKGLKGSLDSISSVGPKLTGIGTGLTVGVTGPILAASTALVALVASTGAAADAIDKMSERTGISRTSLQELEYVAGQTGVSFSVIESASNSLGARLNRLEGGSNAAAQAFQSLGIETETANGEIRRSGDIFEDAITALASIEDEGEQARKALELFGAQGAQLLPLLRVGAGGIEELRARAHELGVVLDDETISSLVGMQDALDDVKKAFAGLGNDIVREFAPIIKNNLVPLIKDTIVPALREFAERISSIIGWFNDLNDAQKTTIGAIVVALAASGPLLMGLGRVITAVNGIKNALVLLKPVLLMLSLNPATAIVLAVAGLAAIGSAMYFNEKNSAARAARGLADSIAGGDKDSLVSALDKMIEKAGGDTKLEALRAELIQTGDVAVEQSARLAVFINALKEIGNTDSVPDGDEWFLGGASGVIASILGDATDLERILNAADREMGSAVGSLWARWNAGIENQDFYELSETIQIGIHVLDQNTGIFNRYRASLAKLNEIREQIQRDVAAHSRAPFRNMPAEPYTVSEDPGTTTPAASTRGDTTTPPGTERTIEDIHKELSTAGAASIAFAQALGTPEAWIASLNERRTLLIGALREMTRDFADEEDEIASIVGRINNLDRQLTPVDRTDNRPSVANAELRAEAARIASDTDQAMAEAADRDRAARVEAARATMASTAELQAEAAIIRADTAQAIADADAAGRRAIVDTARETMAQNVENQEQAAAIAADTQAAMEAAAERDRVARLEAARAEMASNAELQSQAAAIIADTYKAIDEAAARAREAQVARQAQSQSNVDEAIRNQAIIDSYKERARIEKEWAEQQVEIARLLKQTEDVTTSSLEASRAWFAVTSGGLEGLDANTAQLNQYNNELNIVEAALRSLQNQQQQDSALYAQYIAERQRLIGVIADETVVVDGLETSEKLLLEQKTLVSNAYQSAQEVIANYGYEVEGLTSQQISLLNQQNELEASLEIAKTLYGEASEQALTLALAIGLTETAVANLNAELKAAAVLKEKEKEIKRLDEAFKKLQDNIKGGFNVVADFVRAFGGMDDVADTISFVGNQFSDLIGIVRAAQLAQEAYTLAVVAGGTAMKIATMDIIGLVIQAVAWLVQLFSFFGRKAREARAAEKKAADERQERFKSFFDLIREANELGLNLFKVAVKFDGTEEGLEAAREYVAKVKGYFEGLRDSINSSMRSAFQNLANSTEGLGEAKEKFKEEFKRGVYDAVLDGIIEAVIQAAIMESVLQPFLVKIAEAMEAGDYEEVKDIFNDMGNAVDDALTGLDPVMDMVYEFGQRWREAIEPPDPKQYEMGLDKVETATANFGQFVSQAVSIPLYDAAMKFDNSVDRFGRYVENLIDRGIHVESTSHVTVNNTGIPAYN